MPVPHVLASIGLALVLCACGSDVLVAPTPPAVAPTPPAVAPTPDLGSPLETKPPAPSHSAAPERGRIGLPDRSLTPGATNPAVTPANIAATICRTGWTKTVRPPVSYTGALKVEQIAQYGYSDRNTKHYQEDHLIALSLGGAPRDPANLWPQPLEAVLSDGTDVGASTKDGFELYLHHGVCSGSVALRAAQHSMATDWIAAWEAAGRP